MKKLIAIILVLTMLVPYTAFAGITEKPVRLISDEEYALVDAMWQELTAAETHVLRGVADATTAKTVASAAVKHELYVPGTLKWNGDDHFTFETTVGVTCGYSARLRNIALQAEQCEAATEPEVQVVSYATKNAPFANDVYLIEPYYQIDTSFTKQYQNEAKSIAEATGGTYHLYTKTAATIDVVAQAIEKGAVVIFDSHGDTDFARGDDYTSGATTSYLLLQTGTGLTDEDYANDNGTYHAKYYGSYGSMKYYAVDGTCIANHMGGEAPHSLLWMAICLGMATDGLHAPLRENGVEVVYGYSQSVTFDYDYLWEECFFDEMIDGKTVASAIATMKKEVGLWDYCDYYTTISMARAYDCAFPIVVSSEDVYPGHGKVDALQTVYSTWTLYMQEECAHTTTVEDRLEPTCTEAGYCNTVCEACGAIIESQELEAPGHDYEMITVAPTCFENGGDLYTCLRCGDSYLENEVPALGHDFVMTTVEPTCDSEGYDLYSCSRCEDYYQENFVPRLYHQFIDEICINCGRACWCELYSDVDTSHWYHDAVVYAYNNKLMNGVGNNLFDPEGELTRAMLVTILYRAAGYPTVETPHNPFVDVEEGQWYYHAVVWAANEGIVNGMSATTFAPDLPITREQIATILYRYSGAEEIVDAIADFADLSQVSDYAIEAVLWAIELGIINGMDGLLAPKQTATRAQTATMLMRYLEML